MQLPSNGDVCMGASDKCDHFIVVVISLIWLYVSLGYLCVSSSFLWFVSVFIDIWDFCFMFSVVCRFSVFFPLCNLFVFLLFSVCFCVLCFGSLAVYVLCLCSLFLFVVFLPFYVLWFCLPLVWFVCPCLFIRSLPFAVFFVFHACRKYTQIHIHMMHACTNRTHIRACVCT